MSAALGKNQDLPRRWSNWWRAALCLLGTLVVGPPIGGFVGLAGLWVTGFFASGLPSGEGGFPLVLKFLLLFYIFGLGPALLAGLVFAGIVWRYGTVSNLATAAISLIGGAIATSLLGGFGFHNRSPMDAAGLLIGCVAALIAALACRALFSGFGILRKE